MPRRMHCFPPQGASPADRRNHHAEPLRRPRKKIYATFTNSRRGDHTPFTDAALNAATNRIFTMIRPLITLSLALAAPLHADQLLSSWYTKDSGKYARLFTSTANETAGASATTWSRGQGVQNAPSYSGVQEISYS